MTLTTMNDPTLKSRLYHAPTPRSVAMAANGLTSTAPAGPYRKAMAKSPTMPIETAVSP